MNRHYIKRTFQFLLLGALAAAIVMRTFDTAPKHEMSGEIVEWDRAIEHVGEVMTVHGPVVQTHYASGSRGRPTFLNIGRPYPETPRFTVVIWGANRDNFGRPPEHEYMGRRIAVTGLIGYYDDLAQIVVETPDELEIID